jgi:hypothetical protein
MGTPATAKTVRVDTAADKRPLLYPLFHALKGIGSVALITDSTGYMRLTDENCEFSKVFVQIAEEGKAAEAIAAAGDRGAPLDFAIVDMAEDAEADVVIEPKESDMKTLSIALAGYVYDAEKKRSIPPLKNGKATKIIAPFVSAATGRDAKAISRLLKGGNAR